MTATAATACPCGSTATRDLPAGRRRRVECARCGRFAGWVDPTPPAAPTPVPADEPAPAPEELGNPAHWLYVSRRLDLLDVPNQPPWNVPAFTHGSTAKPVAFYRLTAAVLVWLEAAGQQLETAMNADPTNPAARDTVENFILHMAPVWAFAERHVPVEAVRVARQHPPALPDAPTPK